MTKPTKVTAWQDSSGTLHTTIEGWQQAEMLRILHETDGSDRIDGAILAEQARDLIKSQSEQLLTILTTGPRSRPRTRKAAGTTNPRRATRAQARTGLQRTRGEASQDAIVDAAVAGGTNPTHDGDVAAEPVGVIIPTYEGGVR